MSDSEPKLSIAASLPASSPEPGVISMPVPASISPGVACRLVSVICVDDVPKTYIVKAQVNPQNNATKIVIVVKVSAPLLPNALSPPGPPRAPANPPPLPRWTRIKRMRNNDRKPINQPRKTPVNDARRVKVIGSSPFQNVTCVNVWRTN